MPFAIGLRFYSVAILNKDTDARVKLGPDGEPCDLFEFVGSFVDSESTPNSEAAKQRSWFFERKDTNSIRSVHGYINYGTHGFESKLKDISSGVEQYARKTTDVEEIPLYFQVWVPSGSTFALMAFQSFSGRSCVSLVRSALLKSFSQAYKSYQLDIRPVVPSASMYDDAPVKSVTFFNPVVSKDLADQYYMGRNVNEVEFEITMKARRKSGLISLYKELNDRIVRSDGLAVFDGQAFESVTATVEFGGRRRTVGVYGPGHDTGLFDVTGDVEVDTNGHPTLDSIANEVDQIMENIYGAIKT